MKPLSALFTILFFFIQSNAQINPKTKWGETSPAEIDYRQVSFEKEAPAVILYEEGKTQIAGSFQTHIYRRIKILDEKGISAANQELIYYSYKGLESFGAIKAQTINIENGKAVVYPVNKNDIFDTKINDYYSSKKFAFPNVKVGSIIELEYNFIDQKLYFIDAWRFQHEYPTLYSSYKVENNMGLDYTSLMVGDKIVEYSKNKKDPNYWVLTNLPSHTSLRFLYNPEDMSERIIFQLSGYNQSTGAFGTTSRYEDVLSDWKSLSRELEDKYKGFTSKSTGAEIAASIPNGDDEKETLKNVYNYFKQNYRWSNFYGIYPKISNREIQKIKNGNSTDLNLLLNSILNAKGFKTDLILLSSRDNGKIFASYSYLGQFNYVVNLVTLHDQSSYLIDASDMDFDLGYAPLRDYNHYGLIIDSQNENFILLNQPVSEFESLQVFNLKNGKYSLIRTDKQNGYFKERNKDLPKGISESMTIENAIDIFLNEIKRDTKDSDTHDFQLTRTISESVPLANTEFIGIENPLRKIISEYKFEEKNRERALEFNYPFHYKTDVVVEIPEGYKVEIPQSFDVHSKISSNEIVYFQKAEVTDGKVLLHFEFYLGKAIFDKNYTEIKSFFEKVNLDASKTILIKKN